MAGRLKISVILATYNRCESLKDTLESLLVQEVNGSLDYEIIVVDNNSKDKTKEVIDSYMPQFNGRLKYIFEPKQGKPYALNTGIVASKGEIICLTDDDVIVDKNWLLNTHRCFQEYNCDGVGGRILPIYPNKVPNWINEQRDLLVGPIVCYDYGEDIQMYKKEFITPFVGANMAYKKDCFNKYGLFCLDMADAGLKVIGEDSEFFRRLSKDNRKLYYCGNALVWHKVERKRISLRYVAYWNITHGRYFLLIDRKSREENFVKWFGIPRYLIRRIIERALSLPFKIFNQRKFLEIWIILFRDIGRVVQYRILYKNRLKSSRKR